MQKPVYHLDRQLKGIAHGAEIGCCGTCLDARGLREDMLIDGARGSTLDELADWTLQADTTLSF